MMRPLALLMCLAGPVFADQITAIEFLAFEQITNGCESEHGSFSDYGLREIDLNADGSTDLIIDHAELTCDNSGSPRSLYCGAQVCSIFLYLRDGDGLLAPAYEIIGALNYISADDPPVLSGIAHGGGAWSAVWFGNGFELTE